MKNLISAFSLATIMIISSCSKIAIEPEAVKAEPKKTRIYTLVITTPGYFKCIGNTCGCIAAPNAKCYEVTVVNSTCIGVGPNGENDGNFSITASPSEPGQLKIYREDTEFNTRFSSFTSKKVNDDFTEISYN